jgi:hypothetical protein
MGHPALAHGHAAAARSDGYARRQPEQTVLYQAVAEHWPAFLAWSASSRNTAARSTPTPPTTLTPPAMMPRWFGVHDLPVSFR